MKKIEQLKQLLWEVKVLEDEINSENKQFVVEEQKKLNAHKCKCLHTRSRHGKSLSINYTDGACQSCKCENFLMN